MAWTFLTPREYEDFSEGLIAAVLMVANLLYAQEVRYFDENATFEPLLHTWSLSIEEQFYLFFPFILIACIKSRRLLTTLSLLCGVSFVSALWGAVDSPQNNFYSLGARAWELLAGALCAVAERRQFWKAHDGVAALGAALIALAVTFTPSGTPSPSIATTVPVLGTMLIIMFAGGKGPVTNLLRSRAAVMIGLGSYGTYLWHQPLFAFAKSALGELSIISASALCVLSLLMGYLSWRWIERPFRMSEQTSATKRIQLFMIIFSALSIVAVGVHGVITKGAPLRFPNAAKVTDRDLEMASVSNGHCFYDVDTNDDLLVGDGMDCDLGDLSGRPAILVGDSFAGQFEPFWDEVGRRHHLRVRSLTTNWCHPSLTEEFSGPPNGRAFMQCAQMRREILENARSVEFVIVGAHFGRLSDTGMTRDVQAFISYVLASSTAKVVIMEAPPQLIRRGVERALYDPAADIQVDEQLDAKTRIAHDELRRLFGEIERVRFVTRAELFGSDLRALRSDGLPYSFDGAHLSVNGAKAAAQSFKRTAEASFSQFVDSK